MPTGRFYLNFLDRSISYIKGAWLVFIMVMFCRNFWSYANSVGPDQTSGLGLHCLPVSLLWDARLKWVKHGSLGSTGSVADLSILLWD